jgi:hypothetical protein
MASGSSRAAVVARPDPPVKRKKVSAAQPAQQLIVYHNPQNFKNNLGVVYFL